MPFVALAVHAAVSACANVPGGSFTPRAAAVHEALPADDPARSARPVPGAPSGVARFDRLELAWPSVDPSRADEAMVVAPSGAVAVVPAFLAEGQRRVRFAPREIGRYRYVIREASMPRRALYSGSFESFPSANPGPVHVDPAQPHRLVFEDGRPFFILGENRMNIYDPSWNYEGKGIDDTVRAMAGYGMTTLRVFIGSDAAPQTPGDSRSLGCLEPRLGEYDETVAKRFDAIFDAAEAHGVYVVLTAFAIGFTPHDAWKGWEDNPYSAARGGPAREPVDFFTSNEARSLAERRLRYIVARWGYSTHLLAIDLLNEPEWDGAIPESVWIPWAGAMARSLREADSSRQLLTVGSVGLQWNVDGDERPLYASAVDDLVEWHLYGPKTYAPHDNALEMARKVRETYGYGKPVFCGEFAYGGEDPSLYDHTHDGIWAAVFAGGGALAHSAPPFNVDSDEPMTPARGRHFRVLADFLSTLDPSRPLEPDDHVRVTRPAGAAVWALGKSGYDAFWVLGPETNYGSTVAGARLSIDDVEPGRYRVSLRDDVTGAPLSRFDAVARGATLAFDLPPFVRHLAGTLEPAPP